MSILLTGASGLIGMALQEWSHEHKKEMHVLKRGSREWDPDNHICDPKVFEGVETLIHLGGENISAHRWSAKQKEKLWNSRVLSTELLVETLGKCKKRPKLFICASAIGWYGDRGDEVLTENSPPPNLNGHDFLSELCGAWERAAMQAEKLDIRVVHLRFGVVLSAEGGMIASLLPAFRWGGGGVLGSGKQWMSWIAIEDVVGMVKTIIENESLQGAINATSPHPVTNKEFTKTLGGLLHRPTLFPMPAFLARLLFGEMADALLLSSARVLPEKMTRAGYIFLYPNLVQELQHIMILQGK